MKRLALLMTILVALVTRVHATETGWSPAVDGLQARLLVEPGEVTHGVRYLHTVLEIRNVSDVGNPLYLWYDPTASLLPRLLDAQGRPLPAVPAAASVLSPAAHFLAVPWRGSLRFDVTAFGWSVPRPDGPVLGLHRGVWTLPPGQKRSLAATFVGVKPSEAAPGRLWTGRLAIPPTPVEPTDWRGGASR